MIPTALLNPKADERILCAHCGKSGAWVDFEPDIPDKRYHVLCGFEAKYILEMAKRGQQATEISWFLRRKFEKLAGKVSRLKPPIEVLKGPK